MKAAVYQKIKCSDPSDQNFDPTDIELHYWVVKSETEDEALSILERRWDVPWRDWLVEIIDLSEMDNWLMKNQLDCYELIKHS